MLDPVVIVSGSRMKPKFWLAYIQQSVASLLRVSATEARAGRGKEVEQSKRTMVGK